MEIMSRNYGRTKKMKQGSNKGEHREGHQDTQKMKQNKVQILFAKLLVLKLFSHTLIRCSGTTL